MYDLHLMPIHIRQGQPLNEISGFQAAGPPKRAARSRSEDRLLLSLTTKGSDFFSPEAQQAWLDHLTQIFFKTSGSVTSALRSLIETLNLTMMEKNVKMAENGGAITGAINFAAVHHRQLYIVQSGWTHAFTLTHQGLQHFYDESQSDRGLGLTRMPNIRYYQTDLGTGAYFFVTESPLESWTEARLFADEFPKSEQLRRRLLNQTPTDFRLDFVKIIPGDGLIKTTLPTVRPERVASQADSEDDPAAEVNEPAETLDLNKTSAVHELGDTQKVVNLSSPTPAGDEEEVDQGPDEIQPQPEGDDLEASSQQQPELLSDQPETSRQSGKGAQEVRKISVSNPRPQKSSSSSSRLTINQQKELIREKGLEWLAKFFDWWRNVRRSVQSFSTDLLGRFYSSDDNSPKQIPTGKLLLIAVAVPLMVVAIAVGVYLARGRGLQYQRYYAQAEIAAANALAADDPAIKRSEWSKTIIFLDQAESYRTTDEVSELRKEALYALDILDGAVRLAYHPAIVGSLDESLNITRIISYGPDLYLFDAASGRVIHAVRATQGYEINPQFVCRAGNYSGGSVDTLVDMVSLPINNPYQAHILAADTVGNVAYCGPGQDPVVQALPSPGGGAREIKRIDYDSNSLYVLDPSAGTVYVYRSTNGQFLDDPVNFFGGVESWERPDITRVVDLAVNGPEIYLLRDDGLMIDCVYTGLPGNPVVCENPVPYVDGRLGKEDQTVVMPESNYVSVDYTSPPDPAISILDATNADIYRFSLRFRLYQRLRPNLGNYEVDSPEATAFTIGIDRIAFLAFGHQVFYAYVE